jgi:hypothetical protein
MLSRTAVALAEAGQVGLDTANLRIRGYTTPNVRERFMSAPTERRSMPARVAARFTSPGDVLLAVRMFGWALVLPVLKQMVPVRSLAGVMHRAPGASPRDPALEERIVTFARWAARLVRWRDGGNCLERGLIAYRYLGAAGAQPTLVVGLCAKEGGGILGHAWVLLDGHAVGESPSALNSYTPVFAFAADGTLIAVPDAGNTQA